MPLAMSSANFTAWLWSTTRAEEEDDKDRGGQEIRGKDGCTMSSIFTVAILSHSALGPE